MDESTRQSITWIVIVAVVISLIVLGVHRKGEVDNLLGAVANGNAAQRVAAVETLIAKQKLAEAMEDQPRWVQVNAVQAATTVGSEQALFQLIGAKVYLDAPVAAAVDTYLISMGDTAIGPLVQAVQDKDAGVRGGAGGPLKAIGAPTVSSLMPLIDVYDDAVRGLASSTLAGIGEPAVAPLMKIMKQMRPLPDQEPAAYRRSKSAVQSAFIGMGTTAFDPVINQILTDDNPEVRSAGATILGTITTQTKIGAMAAEDASRVVQPLVDLLANDPEWTVRRRAAASLGLLTEVARDNNAAPTLIAALGDERPEVRAAVAKALGEVRAPEAAAPLAKTLMTNRTGATSEIANALAKIGAPSIPPLTPALNHGDAEVRLVATQTIATIGTDAAVAPLGKALGDPDVKIRRAAADALRSLATATVLPQLATALADDDWRVYYAARDALARVGKPAVSTLVTALSNPNTRVAYMAEQALATIGRPSIAALINGLNSASPQAVEWSAIALGDIGHDAVQAAAQLLGNSSAPISARVAAARALGITKTSSATQPLIDAAGAEAYQVRNAAIKALSVVADEKATSAITNSLTDASDIVRETGMSVLNAWRMGEVDKQLTALTQSDDTNTARRAAVVIAEHHSAAGGSLLASLTGSTGQEDTGNSARNIRTLLEAASSDQTEVATVRAAAIEALGYVGEESSLDSLAPLLTQTDESYAIAAAKAVGHIGQRMAEKVREDQKDEVSRPTQLLLDLFKNAKEDNVRMVAGTGLALMGKQPVAPLIEMMTESSPALRPTIAALLGAIGKPATDKVLDERGKTEDKELRAWLGVALKLIGDARALDLLDQLPKEDQPDPKKVAEGRVILNKLLDQL